MDRFLHAQADHGVDTLLKVVGVLRRKEFSVKDVKMTSPTSSKYSRLEIRLHDASNQLVTKAAMHLEKIIGLRDIEIREDYNEDVL
jgi:acetolactate synthase-1/3 small subunit